jgi:hypothetical protein
MPSTPQTEPTTAFPAPPPQDGTPGKIAPTVTGPAPYAPPTTTHQGPTWQLVVIGLAALALAAWLTLTSIYDIDVDLKAYSTLGMVGLGLVLVTLGLVGITRKSEPPR